MKLILYIVIGLVAGLVLLAGVIALIGSRLPKAHSASRSIFLHQSPAQVYAVVRDFSTAPTWRTDLKRVDVEPQTGGLVHFREEGKHGAVNFELAEDVPANRMVTRILDTDLGYSGKWTYVFTAENGGTRVTITEDGEVSNVLFRFMSRYVFGQTATMEAYLNALAKRFGENTTSQ
ncbi:MAG: hypothetical protein QOK48_1572 [Blastocatellia bacterium]|jgi:uncharacterized protein YndB with AHSA1/START domain|nr:hypothetical protein [Blastocatellia bacterium]